jgi:hypothetical protein
MSSWLYFASATQPLRCSTNLSSGIYLASATTPLRYGTNLPLGVYLAPEAPPLRHTLIAVARARTRGNRVVRMVGTLAKRLGSCHGGRSTADFLNAPGFPRSSPT